MSRYSSSGIPAASNSADLPRYSAMIFGKQAAKNPLAGVSAVHVNSVEPRRSKISSPSQEKIVQIGQLSISRNRYADRLPACREEFGRCPLGSKQAFKPKQERITKTARLLLYQCDLSRICYEGKTGFFQQVHRITCFQRIGAVPTYFLVVITVDQHSACHGLSPPHYDAE